LKRGKNLFPLVFASQIVSSSDRGFEVHWTSLKPEENWLAQAYNEECKKGEPNYQHFDLRGEMKWLSFLSIRTPKESSDGGSALTTAKSSPIVAKGTRASPIVRMALRSSKKNHLMPR
jgi:hypothetical protein